MPISIFLTLALLVTAVVPAFAQFETASLVGTVTDGSDAVIPGTTITLTNVETGVTQTRTSDANGNFESGGGRSKTIVVQEGDKKAAPPGPDDSAPPISALPGAGVSKSRGGAQ